MGLSVQTHPDKYEVTLYAKAPPSSFAVVKAIEGGASVSHFLQSTAKCDELIAAACEAKRMLEGARPAAPCPAISDAGTTCIAGEGYPHRDANGYEWGAPDTDDSHPSRWTGPSGMQQPQPVVRVLSSSRCTWWSDPSDDFYGMCVKETGHDREGLDDERVHENEHGIRWTGARWESATAIVAESIATGTPVIIEDDEDIQPPGAGLCADWPGTAPDDGQTYSDDDAAQVIADETADSGEDEVPGDGPCMMVGCGHDLDDHSLDLERGDRLYCQRCKCRRYLSAAALRAEAVRS